jgi:hypothetical protein
MGYPINEIKINRFRVASISECLGERHSYKTETLLQSRRAEHSSSRAVRPHFQTQRIWNLWPVVRDFRPRECE